MSKLASTLSDSGLRSSVLSRRRCLLLQVEPTSYILHRLTHFDGDQDFRFEVKFITANESQQWNLEQDVGEVLLDPSVSRWTRFKRVAKLSKLILSGSFSVAFLAGWGSPLLVYFSLLSRLSGTPFCFDSDTQLAEHRDSLKEKIKSLVYPLYLGMAAAVFPAGTRQEKFFHNYKVDPERIHVSHMTVDVKRIRELPIIPKEEFRKVHGLEPGSVVFIFVGRLETFKGIPTLLQAFEKVNAANPGCALVVIGEGSLRAEVESFASTYPNVKYQGRLGFESVMQWMHSSDALILPSEDEPWGLVLNEAMACGLPLIVSDRVGAGDDLVEHGRNGFVVKTSDAKGLADAMLYLAENSEGRKRMGEASYGMITPWTLETEVEIMRRVFLSVSK